MPDTLALDPRSNPQEQVPLLLFFEHDGAAACRWAFSKLQEALIGGQQVPVVRVDAQSSPELAAAYAVAQVPCVVLVRPEKPSQGLTGVLTAAYLKRWLAAGLA